MTRLADWSARDLDAAYGARSEFDPAYEYAGPSRGVCDDCKRSALVGEDGLCVPCEVAAHRRVVERAATTPDPWAEVPA